MEKVNEKNMEKSLTVMDRITLSTILPTEGNIIKLKIISDIRKKVEINQDEMKAHALKTDNGGMMTWSDPDKKYLFTFTELEEKEIKSALDKMNKAEKLTENHLPLCEMFEIS